MTDTQQREAARQFFYKWNGKGKEDEDARSYWIDILQDVLGMEHVTDRVDFEKKVLGADGNTKRIDIYIPETHVLIEQKSLGIPLDKPQAGHDGMTPYEQAKMYDNDLPFDEKARWIVISNFAEIWIYDMNQKKPELVKIQLTDLQSKYHMLDFLMNKEAKKISEEMELSLKAGELVGKIHDRFLEKYHDPMAVHTQRSLNILCVRLVFCLYAEDAGLFGAKDAFSHYIAQYEPKDIRRALIDLFKVLDAPSEERPDMYLSDELAAFPYVNGGLFQDENIVIPQITDELKEILLESSHFDWSRISPTIFGAVFESTLNPETRRSGGMHYTSIENIHKVIDPLFLDELKAELAQIKTILVPAEKTKKLKQYQQKLAGLTFLDPACGSGNFLTETYVSLRRLENEVLLELHKGQVMFASEETSPIQVSISQFYGIEINDFAVTVAKTALWIAESQMMKETEDVVLMSLDFLPLKTNANIIEGNALLINWERIIAKDRLSYIMGNPPFVGGMYMSPAQKDDITAVMQGFKSVGELDYVAGWYKKAADYMRDTSIHSAFVSTNSICQGQQATTLWGKLIEYGLVINYAHQTFIWDSEASIKAHVHCIIVGFSYQKGDQAYLYDAAGNCSIVSNINQYLTNGPTAIIDSRSTPICDVPPIRFGSMPRDGGGFILSEEEKTELIRKEPLSEQWIHLYLGAEEFLNNKKRYCLWLVGANPADIAKCPTVKERIQAVREFRLASKAAGTRKFAETPSLFCQIAQPTEGQYIPVPKTSSGRRRYIPLGFLDCSVIASDLLFLIPDADLFHFGVLESNVHMAWMRTVCGRLKSDYRYSKDIVYNNFPWPSPTEEQKQIIETTARGILEARKIYPNASLAELYDETTMPPELIKAHKANDLAVMKAYGMPIKETDEAACVAWLMRLYQEKTEK